MFASESSSSLIRVLYQRCGRLRVLHSILAIPWIALWIAPLQIFSYVIIAVWLPSSWAFRLFKVMDQVFCVLFEHLQVTTSWFMVTMYVCVCIHGFFPHHIVFVFLFFFFPNSFPAHVHDACCSAVVVLMMGYIPYMHQLLDLLQSNNADR